MPLVFPSFIHTADQPSFVSAGLESPRRAANCVYRCRDRGVDLFPVGFRTNDYCGMDYPLQYRTRLYSCGTVRRSNAWNGAWASIPFWGTTGGVDIVARILGRNFGWSMGQIILAIDIIIIGSSILYIPKEKILYTLVAVFISSRVIDFIQEGAYAAKAFTIISDDAPQIADLITAEMDRGVTLIPAIGAYSKQAKYMVYCVVSRQEIRRLSLLVKSVDPRAFVIISDVHDVHGEGFRET